MRKRNLLVGATGVFYCQLNGVQSVDSLFVFRGNSRNIYVKPAKTFYLYCIEKMVGSAREGSPLYDSSNKASSAFSNNS